MLKGKRAVVTGGGRDFGQAVSVWLAREGVHVDFCARKNENINDTSSIIQKEGGSTTGYLCDMADPNSVKHFTDSLLENNKPIDILILNAAQWLEGQLAEGDETAIISTINSGLTGSAQLTHSLLPSLQRSNEADIFMMISVCGIPQFTKSIAHPAFFAAKHGLSGFCQNLSHNLAKENIRVTGLYPPDFEVAGFDVSANTSQKMGDTLLSGWSIWQIMHFILMQPRSFHINTVYFQGPTRQDLGL